MNDTASHHPGSPAASFAVGAISATAGAICAAFAWLIGFGVTFAWVAFLAQPWTFAVAVGAMLLPGLLARFNVVPLRWFGIGFTLPTLAILALLVVVIAMPAVTQLPPNFS